MKHKILHIVAFDVPYPPDYGGVIDVFYKLKALHENGVKILLHCFDYGRGEAKELEKYCSEVYYYSRKSKLKSMFTLQPYIVASRLNEHLINRLKAVEAPILFEGQHTVALLDHPDLKERKTWLRQHNVEWRYYKALAENETKWLKKTYFKLEQFRLKRSENLIAKANILAISKTEYNYYKFKYNHVFFVPPFHANQSVSIREGMGRHILYHGNLSINENQNIVKFLINEVYDDFHFPFIFAGKNPPADLVKLINSKKNMQLVANPDSETMQQLIQEAHIHILPTFQTTGIKLKLLSALYNGRHCLVNPEMLTGTGLDELCTMASDAEEFSLRIKQLQTQPFNKEAIEQREQVLHELYNNQKNVEKLIDLIW